MPKKLPSGFFAFGFSMALPAGLPAAGLVGARFGGGAGAGESFTDGMDGMDGMDGAAVVAFGVTAAFGAFAGLVGVRFGGGAGAGEIFTDGMDGMDGIDGIAALVVAFGAATFGWTTLAGGATTFGAGFATSTLGFGVGTAIFGAFFGCSTTFATSVPSNRSAALTVCPFSAYMASRSNSAVAAALAGRGPESAAIAAAVTAAPFKTAAAGSSASFVVALAAALTLRCCCCLYNIVLGFVCVCDRREWCELKILCARDNASVFFLSMMI